MHFIYVCIISKKCITKLFTYVPACNHLPMNILIKQLNKIEFWWTPAFRQIVFIEKKRVYAIMQTVFANILIKFDILRGFLLFFLTIKHSREQCWNKNLISFHQFLYISALFSWVLNCLKKNKNPRKMSNLIKILAKRVHYYIILAA